MVPTANPLKVLTDFELAAINAFREEFPEAELSGCYFHLSQSIVRKVGELGLKNQFENDQNLNVLVKSLAALSFVPIEDVNEVFARLAEQFPQNEACEDLLAYFEANYRIRNPRFPPTFWNHFTDALGSAPKTTNCCEGFHNALQGMFQVRHPTVWRFFEGLRKDMGLTRLKTNQENFLNPEARRTKYVDLAVRLMNKTEEYEYEMDKLRYLRAIAHMHV